MLHSVIMEQSLHAANMGVFDSNRIKESVPWDFSEELNLGIL
jgi:hypothetical protein